MFERLKAKILFHKLLYRPDINKAYAMVGPEDSWYKTISTVHESLAKIHELPHEVLQIKSHDGLKLEGIYYPNGSRKTLIWVHGYTSHAERESAFPGLFYRSLGFNVLIPYLRAHDRSEGKYISLGALEHLDMMRWVDKVNELHPDGQIVLHGLSMGGGIVLDLASKEMRNVKCMVADAPSESIAGALKGMSHYVFKEKAERIYPQVLELFKREFHADAQGFDREITVADGRYPLLLSAGSNEKMEGFFTAVEMANPQPTHTVILPGCDHGNGMYKQTQLYQDAIRDFINRYLEN